METNIIEIIRARRYVDIALRQLLSKADRTTLWRKAQHLAIDPEVSDDEEFE